MSKTRDETISQEYEAYQKADEALSKELEKASKNLPKIYTDECEIQFTRELTLFKQFRLAGIAAPLPELDMLHQCQHKVQPTKK